MPWHQVARSVDVPPGEVAAATIGDRDLVVWRGRNGAIAVMDARCPHEWSHLAAEGVVDGDEIVCTAHFWRFDLTGHGTKQAMSGRRDEKAPIDTYACRERDGAIEADLPATASPSDVASGA